jgi:hypothetical protein
MTGPAVGYREDGLAVAGVCPYSDPASGHVVAYGVVHEVGREPLGEARIAQGQCGT